MRWPAALIAMGAAIMAGVAAGGALPTDGRALIGLTASAPDGELTLPSATAPPAALRLAVTGVENPSMQGVAIALRLRLNTPAGRIERALGAVALFPSNQPGNFTISLPAKVANLVAHAAGPVRLLVHLQSPTAGRMLIEPLKVSLAQPRWR
jgi:hypothetical protein